VLAEHAALANPVLEDVGLDLGRARPMPGQTSTTMPKAIADMPYSAVTFQMRANRRSLSSRRDYSLISSSLT
jgi:hypothetical protein